MKILVTGAAGFVGQTASRTFTARGHDVRAPVRAVADSSAHGIEWLAVGDYDDVIDWGPIVADCEAVVHLAAYAHDLGSATRQMVRRYHKVNVELTSRIATAAVEAGINKFVYLSSVKVYGERSRPTTCGDWQRFTTTDAPARTFPAISLSTIFTMEFLLC